jgi:DNA-binding IclR family transcriptional regulator
VHRLLDALQAEGLAQKDPGSRRYRLGFGLLQITLPLLESLEIRKVAYPTMVNLAQATGEAVYLTVRDELHAISVERVDSPQWVRMVQPIGLRLPLHLGASRKVILAHLPVETLERYFSRFPKARELKRQLATIRRQGYALSQQEVTDWSASVAAPIFNYRGEVTAGICASGPRERFSAGALPRMIQHVTEAARTASRLMGADASKTADT